MTSLVTLPSLLNAVQFLGLNPSRAHHFIKLTSTQFAWSLCKLLKLALLDLDSKNTSIHYFIIRLDADGCDWKNTKGSLSSHVMVVVWGIIFFHKMSDLAAQLWGQASRRRWGRYGRGVGRGIRQSLPQSSFHRRSGIVSSLRSPPEQYAMKAQPCLHRKCRHLLYPVLQWREPSWEHVISCYLYLCK